VTSYCFLAAEIESMKHQMSSLRVLRSKIAVPKRVTDPVSAAKAAVELANSAISSEVNDNTVHKADGDNGAAATAMETSLTN
jgi:hypothetical protein